MLQQIVIMVFKREIFPLKLRFFGGKKMHHVTFLGKTRQLKDQGSTEEENGALSPNQSYLGDGPEGLRSERVFNIVGVNSRYGLLLHFSWLKVRFKKGLLFCLLLFYPLSFLNSPLTLLYLF